VTADTAHEARYSIGETARRCGLTMDTLRYYERLGLIGDVERSATGQRRYSDDQIGWIGTLKCLRDTGMPIEIMCRFAALARDGDHTVADRISLLEAHHEAVGEHIRDLEAKRDYIAGKIDYYKAL
jgi:DNA-binding transcriptional MerR regulator